MTRSRICLAPLLVILAVQTTPPTSAQWPDDPTVNFAVADRVGGQTLPLIESTSDGGVYVAWFDPQSGFDVYLQRLDAAGVEQWPHNGVLVSDHPQDSALFGWDMIVDSADNAVIVFSDVRSGGDLDIYAYRVDPTGQMLWGPNGVTLSDNADFEPAPRVIEASDGDFVFVWLRSPSSGDGDIRMQRLSPDGTPQLIAGGRAVVRQLGETPAFAELAAADNGNVIMTWLRDITTFASPRHVRAQKFSPTGIDVWASPVDVYDLFSVPIGYFPKILADGNDGAFVLWHRSDGSFFNSFVQHLDTNGTELFPANGVEVSTTPNMHHIDPAFALDEATGEVIVFWNERIANQSQWGIFAQKISAAGTRSWGNGGIELLPVDTVFKSFPRSVPADGGAMVFLVDTPGGVDRLIGMRLDTLGSQVWGSSPVVVSSRPGGKSRYPVTVGPDGIAKLAWEDDAGSDVDIYTQSVNLDGSLGMPVSPGNTADSVRVGKSIVMPGDIVLSWSPSCLPGAQNYAIYEGTIGSFYGHVRKDCNDNDDDFVEEVTPAPGNRYYLVVPLGSNDEGSYGRDSGGSERPIAAPACATVQDLAECPR